MPAVVGLALTPVKGTRLHSVEEVEVGRGGVRENRRFYLVDESGQMLNGKQLGEMNAVVARYSDSDRRLSLSFPGGQILEGKVEHGAEIATRFFSRTASARVVNGPWAEALSRFAGRTLRAGRGGRDERCRSRGPRSRVAHLACVARRPG